MCSFVLLQSANCNFRFHSLTIQYSTCLTTISSSLQAALTSFRSWKLSTDEWLLVRRLPVIVRLMVSRRRQSMAMESN